MHSHAAIKVHSVDANCRVVFDSQVDMFADAKSEIARFRKILLLQLVFLDFEATLKNFLRLGPSHSDMDGDFFITSNAKSSDCVASLAFCENILLLWGFLMMKR